MMTSSFPSSSSKSCTSTPLKSKPGALRRSGSVDSSGDSTSSLLSPIYHDSFESSEDEPEHDHNTTVTLRGDGSRDDVETMDPADGSSDAQLKLSAWEQWVVDKAREDRVKKQQKAMEDLTLKEKQEREKKEKLKKKVASDCKIQEWLQMKREQEKKERISKEFQKSKEELEEEKRRAEIEMKAQGRYQEWLRKKKQDEMERKLKEKVQAARREMEEHVRQKQAEESFKEWLEMVKTKGKVGQSSAGNYNNVNYPSPSFVNPIPWKPIHIPKPDTKKNLRSKKVSGPPKSQSTPCLTYRQKDTLSFACKRR